MKCSLKVCVEPKVCSYMLSKWQAYDNSTTQMLQ